MEHRLFRPTVPLALVLLTITAGLWIRSCWFAEGFSVHNYDFDVGLGYNNGRLLLSISNLGVIPAGCSFYRAPPLPWDQISTPSFAGFSWHTTRSRRADLNEPTSMPSGLVLRPLEVTHVITFPLALPVLLAAALFAWRYRRRANLIPGRCPTCGYDLRATPHCCPECGTAFPARNDA
jgi:hypothetical protein